MLYEVITDSVVDALLAIEDNHFYDHKGIDFKGTLRAVKQKLLNEDVQTVITSYSIHYTKLYEVTFGSVSLATRKRIVSAI